MAGQPAWRLAWPGPMVRACMAVVLVAVLLAMAWAALLLGGWSDAQLRQQVQLQQETTVQLWAQQLSARLEGQQQLLLALAQEITDGAESADLARDAPAHGFESLYLARLQAGKVVIAAQSGGSALSSQSRELLRRSLSEGQLALSHVPEVADKDHLRLLISMPLRSAEGRVTAALVGGFRWPLRQILPASRLPDAQSRYLLLSADGTVLAHTQPSQRWSSAATEFGGLGVDWQGWSAASAAAPHSLLWEEHRLLTRIGLQVAQWQAVAVTDLSPDLLGFAGLPESIWWPMALGGLLLGALAVMAIWFFSRPLRQRLEAVRARPAQSPAEEVEQDEAGLLQQALDALQGSQEQERRQHDNLQAQFQSLLDASPAAMLVEHDGVLRLASPQAATLLGYSVAELGSLPVEQLFAEPADLQQAREAVAQQMAQVLCFEGRLQLRRRDGSRLWVQAFGQPLARLRQASVWTLKPAWVGHLPKALPEQRRDWNDALTGLPNREAFLWGLQAWAASATQPAAEADAGLPSQGCLLFADIDHLGMINELGGREVGDAVLRHVGRILASQVRPLGRVARLGGDEFAVLLPGISLAHAQTLGQQLCEAVLRWEPNWKGERYWISVSIGVVAMDALRHLPGDAVRAVDMACYEAKRRGRCQVAAGQVSGGA